ncbi:MAG: DinB family protein [Acidobacteriia bacterium]|nr:DinB family protein [Terriglobia bacterium]
MTPEAKIEIVQILEQSRREFNDAIGGISEAQSVIRPDPERWSVSECIEHVTTAEIRFLSFFENAGLAGAPPQDKQKEANLTARVTDRGQRAQAPEPVRPIGRFPSLTIGIEEFNAVRTRSIAFAESHCDDLYSYALQHPRFGPLNGYEFMLIIAGHARRHAAQIREIKTGLGAA